MSVHYLFLHGFYIPEIFLIEINPLYGDRHDLSGDFDSEKLHYSSHIINLIVHAKYNRYMENISLTLSSNYIIIFSDDNKKETHL